MSLTVRTGGYLHRLRTPRRAVSVIFMVCGALFGVWASRIPAVAAALKLDETALGLVLLCLAGGAVLAFPLAGRLADRLGPVQAARLLVTAFALALPLLAVAPSPAVLAAALLLFGAAFGSLDVAMNAWAAEVEQAMQRPVMASFHALYSVGAGLGAASGAAASAAGLSVGAHFLVAAAFLGPLALWMSMVAWPSRPAPRRGPVFALPRGGLLVVGLVAFCGSVGEGAAADWGAVFMARSIGTGDALAAMAFAVFSVVMVAVRLVGDRLVARRGAIDALRLSALAALAGAGVLLLAPSAWVALAGFALLGGGYALIMPLAFARGASDPAYSPGAGVAAVATLAYGGMLLGPPVIGGLAGLVSLRAAFGVLVLLALATLALAPHFRR